MRRIFALLLTLAWGLSAGFAAFLLLVRSPVFAGIDILFYRGMILCVVAAALVCMSLIPFARRHREIDAATIVAAGMTSLAFNIAFLVLIPVTIDRSISVFLLSQVEAHQGDPSLSEPDLRSLFVTRYVGGMAQIQRRVREQSLSGNIVVTHGNIRLTPRGGRFLRFARLIARMFHTDPRFVGIAPDGHRVVKTIVNPHP